MSSFDKLQSALAERGYKITSARKQVYAALAHAAQPLSNAEVIGSVKDTDKVSVYRTLELYESLGITHRIWNGFKSKVELSDPFSPHHHHFTCTSCGKVISFKDKEIERVLTNLEQTMKISVHYHLIELGGECDGCKNKG
jgi:Fur family ferric uptake transcriptional regulator